MSKIKKTNLLLVLITALICAIVFGFGGLYLGRYYYNNKNSQQKNNSQDKRKVGIFIPQEYLQRTKQNPDWPIYNDYDNNFSFQFPPIWHVRDGDYSSLVPYQYGGGGFVGLNIQILDNKERRPLLEFYNKLSNRNSSSIQEFTKSQYIKNILIERSTYGAGEGQTAFVADKDKVVELYCGYCSDDLINNIVSTFAFKTE